MQRRGAAVLPLALGLLAVACGGGGSSPSAPAPATLTVASVAPSLAQELNTSLAAALRAGLGIASLDRPVALSLGTAGAQAGFLANCRGGGTVSLSTNYSVSGGGRVVFTNSPVTYSGCGYPFNGRNVTFTGTLSAQGTWTATAASNPVTLAGVLDVSEIGTVQVTCASLSTEAGCNGNVGGIRTGAADTPPNPTPSPSPSGCALFDGSYSGGFEGRLVYKGDPYTVDGDVVVSVSNCVITVSEPGSGTGSVSANGNTSFGGKLTVPGIAGALKCDFTGAFVAQGGGITAGGNWSCGGEASGSGGWRVSRN